MMVGLWDVFGTNRDDRELGFCPILENTDVLFRSNPEDKEVSCADL